MNRLQKKCFIGSAGAHALLLGIMVIGPAFLLSKSRTDDMPVLEFVPAITTDAALSGGGSPNAKPPPPVATPPAPTPPAPAVARPPEAKPETKIEERKVETPKVEAAKPPPKSDEPDLTETKLKKRLPDVSTEIVRRKPDAKAQKQAAAKAQAQQRADAEQRSREVANTVRSLREGLSNSTSVEMPGPGGAAYANYAQVVKSVYTQAWIVPGDLNDDEATTKISVTIARDGTVLSSRILTPSGNAAMDGSIRQVLDRVTYVAPFPEGAKEEQRTFTINFNLKAKKLLG